MRPASPALLFLHYFGGSGASWDEVTARLGPTHPCVAPDLRGFGSNPPGGSYTVDAYADDVLSAAAGFDRFVLVGHSMGGKIATALAARRPAALAGLMLVAPSPPCPEPMSEAERLDLRCTFGSLEGAGRTASAISLRADPASPDFDRAVRERVVEDHMRASRPAWEAWLDRGSREDLSDRASAVAVPVWVVAAEFDAALGPAVQRHLTLPLLPGADMSTVPKSRHLVPLDQPDALAELIRSFVEQVG